MNLAKVHTLISEEELQKRIKEVAEEINRDYAGKSVHLIGILKGSVFYIVDLAKHLNCTVTMDFMSVSSYANASKSSGVVRLIKDLDEPYDENIVYNFHCYSPLIFTHQGAYWIKGMDEDFRMPFESSYETYRTNGRKYIDKEYEDAFPETDDLINASYFKDLFKEAVQIAEQRGVALYCGEYGVIDRADPNETLKWYKCISEAFEMYHIGRSLWSYKEMDFGFADAHYDMIRADLLELI